MAVAGYDDNFNYYMSRSAAVKPYSANWLRAILKLPAAAPCPDDKGGTRKPELGSNPVL